MQNDTFVQKSLLTFFRLAIGWVFLSAGLRQVPDAAWSAAGFMRGSPNLSGFFELMASPPFINLIDAVIPWAHLLIGLALILGICMRLAAVGGTTLMILYYIPRFAFPDTIVEYHLVYAGIIVYLAAVRPGRIWGLESWVAELDALKPYFARHPRMRAVIG